MLTKYRVEKRLPFGFMGQWGQVYKPFDYDMSDVDNEKITYNSREYVEIGMDVQFKRIDDDKIRAKMGLGVSGEDNTILVETTDSYFDDNFKQFECIVGVDDVVYLFNRYFKVDKITFRSSYTPAEQKFFYITLSYIKMEAICVKK